MEKESIIKIMAIGMAALAIAAPILISTMTTLTQGGNIERFTVQTEDTYDEETGELLSTVPPRAVEMLEYAKSKGASSWELTMYYNTHDYALYRNGTIVEQKTDLQNIGGGSSEILWYIHSDGAGSILPYSTAIYLYDEDGAATGSPNHITFSYSGGNTRITGYSWNDTVLFEKTVKMQKLWFGDYKGDYIAGPNSDVQYINDDDIYIFISSGPMMLIHGDTVTVYLDGREYEGDVEYQYEDTDNEHVKRLTGADVSVEYYSESLDEWITVNSHLEPPFKGIVTPSELIYKEPYVSGSMSGMLMLIPAIVLIGIAIWLFRRLSNSE